MQRMMTVTGERRERQIVYNREQGITPTGIAKRVGERLVAWKTSSALDERVVRETGEDYDVHAAIQDLEGEMLEASDALEFERAAILRDELKELKRHVAQGGAVQPRKNSKPDMVTDGLVKAKTRKGKKGKRSSPP